MRTSLLVRTSAALGVAVSITTLAAAAHIQKASVAARSAALSQPTFELPTRTDTKAFQTANGEWYQGGPRKP